MCRQVTNIENKASATSTTGTADDKVILGVSCSGFRDAGDYRDDAGAAAFGLAGCVDLRAAAVALARRRDLLGRGRRERAAESLRWSLVRSEEHTSELQSRRDLVCRLLLEKKKKMTKDNAD